MAYVQPTGNVESDTEAEAQAQLENASWPPTQAQAETAGAAIGGVAAGSACVAAGAAVAAPLCVAAGNWLGGVITGAIIDGANSFTKPGSGHPMGHFTVWSWKTRRSLGLAVSPYNEQVELEALRNIGITMNPTTRAGSGGRVVYGCPYYTGSIYVDGELWYNNYCRVVANPDYPAGLGSSVTTGSHPNWWEALTPVVLGRFGSQAAIVRIVPPSIREQILVPRLPAWSPQSVWRVLKRGVIELWSLVT